MRRNGKRVHVHPIRRLYPDDGGQKSSKTPYQHLKDAQKYVQDASAPFAPGMVVNPEHFQKAILLLEEAKTSILALRASLYRTSSVSEELATKRVSINHQINKIIELIEEDLIPSFRWNKRRSFSPLSSSLHTIEEFFPEPERL